MKNTSIKNRWPKTIPALTADEKNINDDFMMHWHQQLSTSLKYRVLEFFNHGYPSWHSQKAFTTTLEIGAGLGEHIARQRLSDAQKKGYVALDVREQMIESIRKRFPDISVCVANCQNILPFASNTFDRIIAIHVLEHLPHLPAAVQEMHRLCHKEKGRVLIVLPCEGGLLYNTLRKFTSEKMFKKRYQRPYAPFIAREHCNVPDEIIEVLKTHFIIQHKQYYPFFLPSVHANILMGLTLIPR